MTSDILITPAEALRRMGGAPPKRPALKGVATVLPLLAFDVIASLIWVGVYAATKNLILATGVGVAAGVAQLGWQLGRGRKVAAMQWMGLGLVVAMAAIAILTHDPRVIMIKPSIVYVVIGAAMLQPGWMLRYTPPMPVSPIPPSAFVAAGYGIAALMFVSAGLNAWFALETTPTTWALFVAIYPMTSKILGFGGTFAVIRAIAMRNVKAGRFYVTEAA
ncbi:MAG TPA: septation protein IspZ [Caulobacteraceae bacterium]|jgi:hypothetical protein